MPSRRGTFYVLRFRDRVPNSRGMKLRRNVVDMSEERISAIMTKDVIHTVGTNVSVEEAAIRMKQVQRGCLIVVEKGRPVGIITERDLVQKVIAQKADPKTLKVSEVMSHPIITVGPEALISDVATVMSKNNIRRLPVIEGTDLVGVVTVTDFAKHMLRKSGFDPMLAAMARANRLLWETVKQE